MFIAFIALLELSYELLVLILLGKKFHLSLHSTCFLVVEFFMVL